MQISVFKKFVHCFSYTDSYEEEQYNRIVVPAILKRKNKVPSLQELKYSGSLVLGNTHISVGQAVRLPQNYKHVGGYHIEEKVKPLPEVSFNYRNKAFFTIWLHANSLGTLPGSFFHRLVSPSDNTCRSDSKLFKGGFCWQNCNLPPFYGLNVFCRFLTEILGVFMPAVKTRLSLIVDISSDYCPPQEELLRNGVPAARLCSEDLYRLTYL